MYNYIAGTIVTAASLLEEFRPSFQILNTNYLMWYDYAAIKLNTLLETIRNVGLIRKLDATLKIRVNTETLAVATTLEF